MYACEMHAHKMHAYKMYRTLTCSLASAVEAGKYALLIKLQI
jgi:hypothetical protein